MPATVPHALWLVYLGNLLWTVAYDTAYAMVDREDDLRVGIKSSAILFGRHDRLIIAALQLACLMSLYLAGLFSGNEIAVPLHLLLQKIGGQ